MTGKEEPGFPTGMVLGADAKGLQSEVGRVDDPSDGLLRADNNMAGKGSLKKSGEIKWNGDTRIQGPEFWKKSAIKPDR